MRISPVFLLSALLMTAVPEAGAEVLTLRDCIAKALANHPSIGSARESLNAGKERVTQAASPYWPQVTASTGYSEDHSVGGAFGDSITKAYTTSLSVTQNIYDFGKTGNAFDAARLGARATESDVSRVVQEVVLNVKQAYFALLAAKKLEVVAQKTLAQSEGHWKQAEAFFRAGSKPRFDVTRADVDVNNGKLGVITARNNVRLKTIGLYNAMGLDPGGDLAIEDVSEARAAVPPLDQALADAVRNRPEMIKAEADRETARATVKTQEANYLPTLAASGAYNWSQGTAEMGPYKGDLQNSWNAGITLSLPLFEGRITQGKVGEARANLRGLEEQARSQRQAILLEVNQAYADLEGASARIDVTESSLKSARESLDLAEGRYQAGVGPSLEVTDAQVAALKAETDYVQALYDYQLAAAKLAKATGTGME